MITRSLAHLRQHFVGYLALFVALAGTSYAAVNLPKHSIGTAQLKKAAVGARQLKDRSVTQPKIDPTLLALFKGQQGPKGDTGSDGTTGPTGPTYGESHAVFAEAMTPQMDMGPASTTVTTPTAGKLYVFGYNEGANVTCTSGTGVYVGLFVDNTRVPGLNSLAAGTPQNLSFAGVTSAQVAAGTHTVVAKAQCLSGTVSTATTQFAAYGVIVLGS